MASNKNVAKAHMAKDRCRQSRSDLLNKRRALRLASLARTCSSVKAMTTAAQTSRHSSASSAAETLDVQPTNTRPSLFLPCAPMKGKKRTLEYTPGARVTESSALEEAQRKRMRSRRNRANKAWFLNLPSETEDKILAILAEDRSAVSILRLSMVNHGWRETIQNNLQIWHTLYRHWRGPIVSSDANTTAAMQNGGMSQRRMVRLNPTTPRTLPNFRHKTPPIS